ncbi:uncharacterized protein B0T15DRAFT_494324 [Chaetomium strumarium]|uniref:Aminoglycoside phosphotransferase domain-containing protein n=1 Tax=Chaetomium strumarium TaxID=1170767 RepID=A0AAJ0M233_9PEZI|nr:hypothetical protein B0T15DRAFT_494324 [Chaetomium strumarium]
MADNHNGLYDKVLDLILQGLIGSAKGKGVVANLVTQDDDSAVYVVALVALPVPEDQAMDRHLIHLDKKTSNVLSLKPVSIEPDEMKQLLRDNKLGTLKTYQRLSNGAYGTTYKVTVEEPDRPQLIVQLRFRGNVASMNALQYYIRARASRELPVPRTFPATAFDRRSDGLQLQVTGPPNARAFAALWELPVARINSAVFGEAVISLLPSDSSDDGLLSITVGPEKQDGVEGPFDSVSSFLRAWILHRFEKLEAQHGIDEYKALLLPSIRNFVQCKLDSQLPKGLDKTPVVLMHTDLGLHNVLVSESSPYEFTAVIDWEFVSCLPFLCAVPRLIEPMFREGLGHDEKGALLEEAIQPLREAFLNEIKEVMASVEGQTFLEWYEFGLYMKPNAYMKFGASPEERMASWENISVVERFLNRWGQEGPSL